MAILSLDEVLVLIIAWEKRLNHYYRHLQKCLKSERSRAVVHMLKSDQEKALDVLNRIHTWEYKSTEFINPPDYHSEEMLPDIEIKKTLSPAEILDKILSYEEKLESYYAHLRDVLVYGKSKELLDELILFKLGQIKKIKGLMDDYDLVL